MSGWRNQRIGCAENKYQNGNVRSLSVITLNVSGLNYTIKRQR